jgi:tetratricopeptide (TPR) repeat protein
MAKVPLRTYNREIESMTANGHLDEAAAHCQHILKTFSLHVETYQLLGKAFLEARRYTDAADIFQRILMAVPDDFVSHVGMSIIRDDEGRLDESIWHMERAFEVQPSNPAIQGELRRLYGRRDGVEPPKIRLTRDALANMYSQGELFNQAIGEINAVLAEDPNRPDLQVMLARAYYRAGQKVQAAEISANLLRKYPYCMDALRILVDVLPGTSKADTIQTYRNRLVMLDPYAAFVNGSAFTSDQAPVGSVSLEWLEYSPDALPAEEQPNWASSLGIKLEEGKSPDESPAWFSSASRPADGSTVEDAPASEPAPTSAGKDIPEWMRTAGWQETTDAAVEGPSDLVGETPLESLRPSEIPDGVKSIAPGEDRQAAAPVPAEAQAAEVPDWLTEMIPEDASAPEPSSQPGAASGSHGLPDWLAAGDAGKPPEEIPGPEPAKPAAAPAGEVFPAAVPAPEAGAPRFKPEAEDDIPDWLSGLGAGIAAVPPASSSVVEDNIRTVPILPSDLPAKEHTEEHGSDAAAANAFVPSGKTRPLGIEDDALGWLEGLAADQGVKSEELQTNAEDRSQEMPEWLKPAVEGAATVPPAVEPGSAPAEPLPAEQAPFIPTGPVKPLDIEENTMAWLEGLAAKQGAKPEELLTNAEERNQEMPGWLKPAVDGAAAVPPAVEPGSAPAEPLPAEQAPFIPTGPVKPLDIEENTMAWLEGLAAKQGAKPEELLTNSEERNQEIPEWLKPAVEGAAAVPPAVEPSLAPAEPLPAEKAPFIPVGPTKPLNTEEDTMAWLEGLDSKPAAKAESKPESRPKSKPEKKPKNKPESIPEWMAFGELQIPTPDPPAASPPIPAQEQALAPEAASVPPQAGSEKPSSDNDITITSWLNGLTKDEIKQAVIKANEEKAGIVPETPAPVAEELPDWLQDLDQSSHPAPLQAPEQPAQEPEPVQEPPPASAEIPEWLNRPVQPPAESPQPISGQEPISEPEQASWVDGNIPALDALIPTHPEEWQPVGEISSSGKPVEQEPEPEKKVELPPAQAGALASVPPLDKDANILTEAQAQLESDHLDESIKLYVKLVKKGRLLEEVVHDLQEAVYRHPVDVIVWQTLGDALMRANRLQDALDAYTKAEELLR